jgi:hypothetical protein
MPDQDNSAPTSDSLPDGYQEVLYWRVTEKYSRVVLLNIVGLLMLVLFGVLFSSLAVTLGKLPPGMIELGLPEIGLGILAILLTLVLHELIHGLVMRIFGAKPRYGALWNQAMFYATAPGYAFPRNHYIVVALAPFILIGMLVVLGMWLLQGTLWVALFGVGGLFNASGAVGDLWITRIVLRYTDNAYIMDERDGIRVFLPESGSN